MGKRRGGVLNKSLRGSLAKRKKTVMEMSIIKEGKIKKRAECGRG